MDKNVQSPSLRIMMASPHQVWMLGRPFPVHVTVENTSEQSAKMVFDFKLMHAASGNRYSVPLVRPSDPLPDVPTIHRQWLKPHDRITFTVDFNHWIPIIKTSLPAGAYELQGIWAGDILSNTLLIELGNEPENTKNYND